MPDAVPVPPAVAREAQAALAERDRRQSGGTRSAILAALELAAAPVVPLARVREVARWHTEHAAETNGKARTLTAGLWGGAAGRDWSNTVIASVKPRTAAPMRGGMICLYPDDPESLAVDGGDPPEQLHVTLAYVAEDAAQLSDDAKQAITDAARAGAAVRGDALKLEVVGYGTLGDADPPATVLLLQKEDEPTDGGVSIVARVVRSELVDFGRDAFPPEHDAFIPHLTLGYGLPVEDAAPFVGRKITFSAGVSIQLGNARVDDPWGGRRPERVEPHGTALHVDPHEIVNQRALGWTDFHPEDYCHRCGNRNLPSWYVNEDEWRKAAEALGDEMPVSDILCPQCFAEGHAQAIGKSVTWRLAVDPQTAAIAGPLPIIREIPDETRDQPDANAHTRAQRLQRLSRRLNKIDADVRAKAHAGAQVALSEALRQAGVKLETRARNKSKATQAALAACEGRYTPSVLAAVGVTEQELLAKRFDSYGERLRSWLQNANRQRLLAIATELDLDVADLAEWEDRYDNATEQAVALAVAGLGAWALNLLTDDRPAFDQGEQPLDPTLPDGVLRPALAVAEGRSVEGPGASGVGPLAEGELRVPPSPGFAFEIVAQAEPVTEVLTWVHGGSARPFEPHLLLDGTQSTYADWEQDWPNTGDWPPETILYPGDHQNCSCGIETTFVPTAEA